MMMIFMPIWDSAKVIDTKYHKQKAYGSGTRKEAIVQPIPIVVLYNLNGKLLKYNIIFAYLINLN
jgi:hypothetical protein